MGLLAVRLNGDQAAQRIDGRRGLAPLSVQRRQAVEQIQVELAQGRAPIGGPLLVEVVGQQITAVQVEHRVKGGRVVGGGQFGGAALEGGGVDPQRGGWVQAQDTAAQANDGLGLRVR